MTDPVGAVKYLVGGWALAFASLTSPGIPGALTIPPYSGPQQPSRLAASDWRSFQTGAFVTLPSMSAVYTPAQRLSSVFMPADDRDRDAQKQGWSVSPSATPDNPPASDAQHPLEPG